VGGSDSSSVSSSVSISDKEGNGMGRTGDSSAGMAGSTSGGGGGCCAAIEEGWWCGGVMGWCGGWVVPAETVTWACGAALAIQAGQLATQPGAMPNTLKSEWEWTPVTWLGHETSSQIVMVTVVDIFDILGFWFLRNPFVDVPKYIRHPLTHYDENILKKKFPGKVKKSRLRRK